ncbi:MAG: ABC transporter substrate-binding protein, partial [Acidimicrobiales bacterium]
MRAGPSKDEIRKSRSRSTNIRWRHGLRPAACGLGALGLVLGVLGAGAESGASPHYRPVTNYATYVGGQGKANPKLSPIYIGAVNQATAPDAPTPTWSTGVQIVQNYLNQHTGGIDGHPVKVVLCKVPTTVAAATKCGQQFANDANVDAVAAGGLDVGNTALESALKPAKKPLFFGVSLSTVDEKYPYGFILYGTTAQVEAPMASVAKDLHMRSVSLVYPSNIPGNVYQATVIEDALKYVGIKEVYKVGVTTADTNFTEPFEAAHVGKTTLFIFENSGGPACSDAYLTLKSMNLTKIKVLVNVPCATPTVAKADGGQLPHDWYYLTAVPMPGSGTPALTSWLKIASAYGKGAV